jgi:Cu(I)/Ag(I) efflux system membrane protein CusA/SilA
MQRIAVAMIGGMISSTVLTLMVIPAVYALAKGAGLSRRIGVLPPASTRASAAGV